MNREAFYIQRAPRMKRTIPRGSVTIHRPEPEPTKPTFSLMTLILPLVVTIGGITAMVYLVPNANITYQLIFMSMMMTSYLLPGLMYLSAKRQYRTKMEERKTSYLAQMELHREELEEVRREQKQTLMEIDPAPEVCWDLIAGRDGAMWARSPRDDDFLHVRMGTGEVPFGITVRPPDQDGYKKDPLIEAAQQIEEDYRFVSGAPITLPLADAKVIGIVGDRTSQMNLVRTLALHLSVHHSPDEVKLSAVFPEDRTTDWSWMRWFPHAWDDSRQMRYLANNTAAVRMMFDYAYHVLQSRKVKARDERSKLQMPYWVFVMEDWERYEDEPLMHLLLNDAEAVSSCIILLSETRQQLPMQCKNIIEAHLGTAVLYQTVMTAKEEVVTREVHFVPDRVSLDLADGAARMMAPYRLKKSSSGEIPNMLTLFDLFGVRRVEELDPVQMWAANRYPQSLPAPVGVRAGGKEVLLNIHDKIERKGHGPHGLIAGTTGSGKSEAIQSLIAGLALRYHPHDVAFMLIDYKGGGMSNTFEGLPHVVATITNLEGGNLIERARISLRAELERRQRLFNEAGNLQHIDEYFKSHMREKEPLPHLIIVIDEFAQLKKDHPDFMSELISVAAIGRTLGVHLILATQKPAGVVDDKIWSNSRFRICLRVQDDADSKDMLKVPDAAWITTPGRGYVQVGSNEMFELVQFAWSGAPYRPEGKRKKQEVPVSEVDLSGRRQAWTHLEPAASGAAEEERAAPKQLKVFIDHLRDCAQAQGIKTLRGPWMPPLPEELMLEPLLPADAGWDGARWRSIRPDQRLRPVVGLVDDLALQRQDVLTLPLEEGHLLVYGMPGTGKTTFLQTLIVSLVRMHVPDDLHVYILDFGRMHRDLAKLPHVGDLLLEEDAEKIKRLFMRLSKEVNERKDRFANAGVKTMRAYREATGEKLPAILVAVDGYVNFKSAYPDEHEEMEPILREGANLGILFAVTVNRVSDIFDKVRSNFALSLSFEMADPGDYYFAVGRPASPLQDAPEGRGLAKGHVPPLEFQAALPAEGANEFERTAALRRLASEMEQAWSGERAPKVPVLPEEIPLLPLLEQAAEHSGAAGGLRLPIALLTETLETFHVSLSDGPHFLVGGRMESGKTAFLTACMIALAYLYSPEEVRIYAVDLRRSSRGLAALRTLPHAARVAVQEADLAEMLQELKTVVQNRKAVDPLEAEAGQSGEGAIVLLIDDAESFAKAISAEFDLQSDLEYIIKYGRDKQVHVIAAGIAADLASSYDGWLTALKNLMVGFLLGTTDSQDLQLFNIRMEYSETGKTLPSGLGYYARRRITHVKAAYPYAIEGETPAKWVERINKKWEERPMQIIPSKV